MPKQIQIAAHLSVEELEKHYRQAKDGVERGHYQIIWLLVQGKRSQEVAALTGYSRSWIYELVWEYNRIGMEALGDKRHQNPGAAPLLDELQQAQLWQLLNEPPADGGLQDRPKVAQWVSQIWDVPFANLDELEAVTAHRCRVLLERRDLIQRLTNFYWWARAGD